MTVAFVDPLPSNSDAGFDQHVAQATVMETVHVRLKYFSMFSIKYGLFHQAHMYGQMFIKMEFGNEKMVLITRTSNGQVLFVCLFRRTSDNAVGRFVNISFFTLAAEHGVARMFGAAVLSCFNLTECMFEFYR